MADSEQLKDPAPGQHSGDELKASPLDDTDLLRQQLDHYVEDWITHITNVGANLPQEIQQHYREHLAGADERLGRLATGLRRTLDQVDDHVRTRAIELTELEEARRLIDESQQLEEQRSKIERNLREVHNRFESAFENAPIGIGLIDINGQWLQINDALCRITGYTRDELRAITPRALTHPQDVDSDVDYQQQLLTGQIPNYQIEKRYRHAWGYYIWVLVTVSAVRNQVGEALHLISQVQDISERRRLEGDLAYLADHDFLTGLFNRRRLEQELEQEVKRTNRYGNPGAVLVIDLDNFKQVNDAFGHKVGDDLLKSVAQALKGRTRHTDVLARIGGDEFVLLLRHADAGRAEIVAQDIIRTIGRQAAALGDQLIPITASVGVALSDGLTDTEVLAYADAATYDAKEAGRNRVVIYGPSADRERRVSARLTGVERVRQVVKEERLLLYCMPIRNLAEGSDQATQFEVLVRLDERDGGTPLHPSAFLYVAERFGLMQTIDAWVVRQAIALVEQYASAGRRLVLNVNISGKSIDNPKLMEVIEGGLRKAVIDPSNLIFELAERSAISDIESAKLFADRLHHLGCRFAVDDFGAGFGSFYHLKNLPFDYLKIDGEFIRAFPASSVDQLVVTAMVKIAQGLGKQTVAEFVTDEDTVQLLRTIGVDYAQGYHIGLPRPIDEVLRLSA